MNSLWKNVKGVIRKICAGFVVGSAIFVVVAMLFEYWAIYLAMIIALLIMF